MLNWSISLLQVLQSSATCLNSEVLDSKAEIWKQTRLETKSGDRREVEEVKEVETYEKVKKGTRER
jgi:hypothetical protein